MKKYLLALSAAAALLVPQVVGAEGFAVYECSAEGMAMGGARMFAENDAANLAYNPASITKVKGKAAKISATYLSPHGRYDVTYASGVQTGENRVHPAWVPGMYYVQQINDKEWFGMGTYSRFGLISQFERNSLPGSNAFSSKLYGVSLGANYARKFDKKWSASLGAEVNYVGLQLDKNLYNMMPLHIEGESYALGWNAAANYEFDKKNEMGVVYRSKVNHSMEADLDAHAGGMSAYGDAYGDAYGKVTLPESVSIGYNHKFNDRTRIELNGIWTRWDRYQNLDMTFSNLGGPIGNLLNGVHPNQKNWSNGWRYALGLEHKLSDKYSALAGIAYDDHSIPYSGGDFMIPTGRRLTYSIGTQYHDDKQTLAIALGWMKVGGLDFAGGTTDTFTTAHTRDSFTKMLSLSYQRKF